MSTDESGKSPEEVVPSEQLAAKDDSAASEVAAPVAESGEKNEGHAPGEGENKDPKDELGGTGNVPTEVADKGLEDVAPGSGPLLVQGGETKPEQIVYPAEGGSTNALGEPGTVGTGLTSTTLVMEPMGVDGPTKKKDEEEMSKEAEDKLPTPAAHKHVKTPLDTDGDPNLDPFKVLENQEPKKVYINFYVYFEAKYAKAKGNRFIKLYPQARRFYKMDLFPNDVNEKIYTCQFGLNVSFLEFSTRKQFTAVLQTDKHQIVCKKKTIHFPIHCADQHYHIYLYFGDQQSSYSSNSNTFFSYNTGYYQQRRKNYFLIFLDYIYRLSCITQEMQEGETVRHFRNRFQQLQKTDFDNSDYYLFQSNQYVFDYHDYIKNGLATFLENTKQQKRRATAEIGLCYILLGEYISRTRGRYQSSLDVSKVEYLAEFGHYQWMTRFYKVLSTRERTRFRDALEFLIRSKTFSWGMAMPFIKTSHVSLYKQMERVVDMKSKTFRERLEKWKVDHQSLKIEPEDLKSLIEGFIIVAPTLLASFDILGFVKIFPSGEESYRTVFSTEICRLIKLKETTFKKIQKFLEQNPGQMSCQFLGNMLKHAFEYDPTNLDYLKNFIFELIERCKKEMSEDVKKQQFFADACVPFLRTIFVVKKEFGQKRPLEFSLDFWVKFLECLPDVEMHKEIQSVFKEHHKLSQFSSAKILKILLGIKEEYFEGIMGQSIYDIIIDKVRLSDLSRIKDATVFIDIIVKRKEKAKESERDIIGENILSRIIETIGDLNVSGIIRNAPLWLKIWKYPHKGTKVESKIKEAHGMFMDFIHKFVKKRSTLRELEILCAVNVQYENVVIKSPSKKSSKKDKQQQKKPEELFDLDKHFNAIINLSSTPKINGKVLMKKREELLEFFRVSNALNDFYMMFLQNDFIDNIHMKTDIEILRNKEMPFQSHLNRLNQYKYLKKSLPYFQRIGESENMLAFWNEEIRGIMENKENELYDELVGNEEEERHDLELSGGEEEEDYGEEDDDEEEDRPVMSEEQRTIKEEQRKVRLRQRMMSDQNKLSVEYIYRKVYPQVLKQWSDFFRRIRDNNIFMGELEKRFLGRPKEQILKEIEILFQTHAGKLGDVKSVEKEVEVILRCLKLSRMKNNIPMLLRSFHQLHELFEGNVENDPYFQKLFNFHQNVQKKWLHEKLDTLLSLVTAIDRILGVLSEEDLQLLRILSDDDAEKLIKWLLAHSNTPNYNELIKVSRGITDDAILISSFVALTETRNFLNELMYPQNKYRSLEQIVHKVVEINKKYQKNKKEVVADKHKQISFIKTNLPKVIQVFKEKTRSVGISFCYRLIQIHNEGTYEIACPGDQKCTLRCILQKNQESLDFHYLSDVQTILYNTKIPEEIKQKENFHNIEEVFQSFSKQLDVLLKIVKSVTLLSDLGYFPSGYKKAWSVNKGSLEIIEESEYLIASEIQWRNFTEYCRNQYYFINILTMREISKFITEFDTMAKDEKRILDFLRLIKRNITEEIKNEIKMLWKSSSSSKKIPLDETTTIKTTTKRKKNNKKKKKIVEEETEGEDDEEEQMMKSPDLNLHNEQIKEEIELEMKLKGHDNKHKHHKLGQDVKKKFLKLCEVLEKVFTKFPPEERPMKRIPFDCEDIIEGLKEEKILILPSHKEEDIPNIVFSLFVRKKRFPEVEEIVMCDKTTTLEDIKLLLLRWRVAAKYGRSSRIYVIAGIQQLSYGLQCRIVNFLKKLGPCPDSSRLILISSDFEKQRLINAFSSHLYKGPPMLLSERELRLAYDVLCSKMSDICCFASEIAGSGKTFSVRRTIQIKDLEMGIGSNYIQIPFREKVKMEELIERMNKSSERLPIRSYHLNISPFVDSKTNSLLFQLIVLGTIRDRVRCKIFQRTDVDRFFIEVPNSATIARVLPLLAHLPTRPCRVDAESLSFFSYIVENVGGEDFSILEKGNHRVQFVCKFIKGHEEAKFAEGRDFVPDSVYPAPLPKLECFNLLRKYSHSNQPSFAIFSNFIKFTYPQFYKVSFSPYLSGIICQTEGLTEMKAMAVRLILESSKDFSVRNMEFSATTTDFSKRFKTMKKWNDSVHPVLILKDSGLNVISLRPEVINQFASEVLMQSLNLNRLDVSFNFDQSVREQGLRATEKKCLQFLRDIAGIESWNIDMELEEHLLMNRDFVLTPDNLLKMIAIVMRFENGLPVIISGETGCGKSFLIEYMAKLMFYTLIKITCHGGMVEDDLLRFMEGALAKAGRSRMSKFVVFFDEVNACDCLGFFKEILNDGSCNGYPLPDNLKVIAAINPYRRRSSASIKEFSSVGLKQKKKVNDPLSDLVYRVYPIPDSFVDHLFDYGVLPPEIERSYAGSMVAKRFGFLERTTRGTEKELLDLFIDLVCRSQMILREEILQEISVCSLRDISRSIKIFLWLNGETKDVKTRTGKIKTDSESVKRILTNYVIAISFVYYSRLSRRKRDVYLKRISDILGRHRVSRGFKFSIDEFKIILKSRFEYFAKRTHPPPGIALNEALTENIFMLFLSILNKIPLIIIGPPGSSKSLAVDLIHKALKGAASQNDFLRKFPSVEIFTYQCSPISTADSISQVFRTARNYAKEEAGSHCCVLLDEISLAELSPDLPLKVLHRELDESKKISVIAISNYALDAAKMNRAIYLFRSTPTVGDLKITAQGIVNHSHLKQLLNSMAVSYKHVYDTQKLADFWGLREFYYMIKFINDRHPGSGYVDPALMLEAILRNFSGRPKEEVEHVIDTFEKETGKSMEGLVWPTTVELIEQSLIDRKARHLMLLTINNAALHLLFDMNIVSMKDCDIIFASDFPDDRSNQKISLYLQRIKLAMQQGRKVILVHADCLYESLYDLLNQHYVEVEGKRFANIALGHSTQTCLVHDDFKLICVVEEQQAYENLPPPFLNRMEKQVFHRGCVLSEKRVTILRELENFVTNLKEKIPESASLFVGCHKRSLTSLVCTLRKTDITGLIEEIEEEEETEGEDNEEEEEKEVNTELSLQYLINQLVQVMSPEAVIMCQDPSIFKKYFEEQCHSNILDYLGRELKKNDQEDAKKALNSIVLTFSPLDLSLKDMILSYFKNTFDPDTPKKKNKKKKTTTSTTTEEEKEQEQAKKSTKKKRNITIKCLQLHEISNSLELATELDKYFLSEDEESLLLLLCDPHATSIRRIQFLQYECESRKEKLLQQDSTKKRHILLIINLIRQQKGMYTFDFDRRWNYIFIDDIRKSDKEGGHTSTVSLIQSTLYTIFRKELNVIELVKNTLHQSLSKLHFGKEFHEISKYINYLKKTLNKHKDFTKLLRLKILKMIAKFPHQKQWYLEVAKSQRDLMIYGTFKEALHNYIINICSDIFSSILSFIDQNSNLMFLQYSSKNENDSRSKQRKLWLEIFSNLEPDVFRPNLDVIRANGFTEIIQNDTTMFPFSFVLAEFGHGLKFLSTESEFVVRQFQMTFRSLLKEIDENLAWKYFFEYQKLYNVGETKNIKQHQQLAKVMITQELLKNNWPPTIPFIQTAYWNIQPTLKMYLPLLETLPIPQKFYINEFDVDEEVEGEDDDDDDEDEDNEDNNENKEVMKRSKKLKQIKEKNKDLELCKYALNCLRPKLIIDQWKTSKDEINKLKGVDKWMGWIQRCKMSLTQLLEKNLNTSEGIKVMNRWKKLFFFFYFIRDLGLRENVKTEICRTFFENIQSDSIFINDDASFYYLIEVLSTVVMACRESDSYECCVCFEVTENMSLLSCHKVYSCDNCLHNLITNNLTHCTMCQKNVDIKRHLTSVSTGKRNKLKRMRDKEDKFKETSSHLIERFINEFCLFQNNMDHSSKQVQAKGTLINKRLIQVIVQYIFLNKIKQRNKRLLQFSVNRTMRISVLRNLFRLNVGKEFIEEEIEKLVKKNKCLDFEEAYLICEILEDILDGPNEKIEKEYNLIIVPLSSKKKKAIKGNIAVEEKKDFEQLKTNLEKLTYISLIKLIIKKHVMYDFKNLMFGRMVKHILSKSKEIYGLYFFREIYFQKGMTFMRRNLVKFCSGDGTTTKKVIPKRQQQQQQKKKKKGWFGGFFGPEEEEEETEGEGNNNEQHLNTDLQQIDYDYPYLKDWYRINEKKIKNFINNGKFRQSNPFIYLFGREYFKYEELFNEFLTYHNIQVASSSSQKKRSNYSTFIKKFEKKMCATSKSISIFFALIFELVILNTAPGGEDNILKNRLSNFIKKTRKIHHFVRKLFILMLNMEGPFKEFDLRDLKTVFMFRSMLYIVTYCLSQFNSASPGSNNFLNHLLFDLNIIGGSFFPTITEDTFFSIKNAFQGGRFYTCPDGHIYYVSECGRPMQRYTCNVCGKNIGGENHNLIKTNVEMKRNKETLVKNYYFSESEDTTNFTVRKIGPKTFRILRFIIHTLLFFNFNNTHRHLLKFIGSTNIPEEANNKQKDVKNFFYNRLRKDLGIMEQQNEKNNEEICILVYLVMKKLSDGGMNSSLTTSRRLQDVNQREEWENQFQTKIVSQSFDKLDEEILMFWNRLRALLKQQPDELEKEIIGGNPNQQQLQVSVSFNAIQSLSKRKKYLPFLFQKKQDFFFNLYVQKMKNDLQKQFEEFYQGNQNLRVYPLMLTFCKYEDKLPALKELPNIFMLYKLLIGKFHRKITRDESRKLTMKIIIEKQIQSESKKRLWMNSFTGFCKAWNLLWKFVDRYECLEIPQIYKNLTMDENTPLAMYLPNQFHESICCLAFLFYVINLHNNCVNFYSVGQPDGDGAPKNNPNNPLISSHFFNFIHTIDYNKKLIMNFIKDHKDNPDLIEQFLFDHLFANKPEIQLEIQKLEFIEDVSSVGGVSSKKQIQLIIPQKPITPEFSAKLIKCIANNKNKNKQIQNIYKIVEISINFLSRRKKTLATTQKELLEMSLYDYLTTILLMKEIENPTSDEYFRWNKDWKKIKLDQLTAVYGLMEKLLTNDIFYDIDMIYRKKLSKGQVKVLQKAAEKMDLKIIIPYLKDFVLGNLKNKSMKADISLKMTLAFIPVSEEDQEVLGVDEFAEIVWFEKYFPESGIRLAHCLDVYKVLDLIFNKSNTL